MLPPWQARDTPAGSRNRLFASRLRQKGEIAARPTVSHSIRDRAQYLECGVEVVFGALPEEPRTTRHEAGPMPRSDPGQKKAMNAQARGRSTHPGCFNRNWHLRVSADASEERLVKNAKTLSADGDDAWVIRRPSVPRFPQLEVAESVTQQRVVYVLSQLADKTGWAAFGRMACYSWDFHCSPTGGGVRVERKEGGRYRLGRVRCCDDTVGVFDGFMQLQPRSGESFPPRPTGSERTSSFKWDRSESARDSNQNPTFDNRRR